MPARLGQVINWAASATALLIGAFVAYVQATGEWRLLLLGCNRGRRLAHRSQLPLCADGTLISLTQAFEGSVSPVLIGARRQKRRITSRSEAGA